jgi:hypothetical protein
MLYTSGPHISHMSPNLTNEANAEEESFHTRLIQHRHCNTLVTYLHRYTGERERERENNRIRAFPSSIQHKNLTSIGLLPIHLK